MLLSVVYVGVREGRKDGFVVTVEGLMLVGGDWTEIRCMAGSKELVLAVKELSRRIVKLHDLTRKFMEELKEVKVILYCR